ncbi:MAG: [citrate (pro-3S)-lyase] ligase [Prevotellaceae bacterium]|nr:[citrate (pro-3S)-lyase] ligase [Prevotellaceae bacterium]MDY6130361.1 [citrate (pro-3S)-lyase] ligase [Prevotella sp.]
MYGEFDIRELPLSLKPVRQKVESFLASNELRLEQVDAYAAVFANGGEEILAGGGLLGNTIKCVAVSNALRGTGMGARLISHLVCMAAAKGHSAMQVFTKPLNVPIFSHLGFNTLASSPRTVFMENSNQLELECSKLKKLSKEGTCGIIVMNANPFTLGHRFLVEQAASRTDHLFVMVVREEKSLFCYEERKAMVTQGCSDLKNVTVCDGSRYVISSRTFPTYFLKRMDDATDEQILLDLNLFVQHIAPALGASIRFVGSEPTDPLTHRYNQLMHNTLPAKGLKVMEIERLQMPQAKAAGKTVSASLIRKHLAERRFLPAAAIACPTTIPYIIAELAEQALHDELETTPKPGLVDRHDNGAHSDMNFSLMDSSIKALRPYFVRLAIAGFQSHLPSYETIHIVGMEAERAMFQSTQGVNTYKGALFSMGLTIVAAAHVYHETNTIAPELLRHHIAALASQFPAPTGTHGAAVAERHQVAGARTCACQAYPLLFSQWLPFFGAYASDPFRFHKTLLLIMSSLDDTNLFYRGGPQAVRQIKEQSRFLLEHFSLDALQTMNHQMIQHNLSPGGSADMLSLTAFIHSLLQ